MTNIWIPDGFIDTPIDRRTPRLLLKDAFDIILAEKIESKYNLDSVEPKLFGIGSESLLVGSRYWKNSKVSPLVPYGTRSVCSKEFLSA